jgi:hypothetical protein
MVEVGEFGYGEFGWILDPEGNKIGLWKRVDGKKLAGVSGND